jgi:hypothetical protein
LRYFIDTEFSERGPSKPIELISIALVTEGDLHYYAVSGEYTQSKCNDFVKTHVLPKIVGVPMKTLSLIKTEIIAFIGDDKPEFWGYFADYDWVAFCQIFGTMMDLPRHYPMYCRDIKQLCDDLGNPPLPKQGKGEHNALADARWNRHAYNFLRDKEKNVEPIS